MNEKIVLLVSGGLDSTTLLYWLLNKKYDVYPMYVDYGSKHKSKEYECLQSTCKKLGLNLFTTKFDLTQFNNSALTSKSIDVPGNMEEAINTVVPYRNMMLVVLASMYAESIGAYTIALSPTKEDYTVYRDCRRTFFTELETALSLGAKTVGYNIEILTPFIDKTKSDIIIIGDRLHVPFEDTWTCYKGGAKPCGVCPACQVRAKGFSEASMEDPLLTIKPKPTVTKTQVKATTDKPTEYAEATNIFTPSDSTEEK